LAEAEELATEKHGKQSRKRKRRLAEAEELATERSPWAFKDILSTAPIFVSCNSISISQHLNNLNYNNFLKNIYTPQSTTYCVVQSCLFKP
jgi:hypothetical protein